MSDRFYVGIDIGGTFTDLVAVVGATGQVTTAKTPTTPESLEVGILVGLEVLASALGLPARTLLGSIDRLAHGTTITVNALLQARGVRTGLITTRGFEEHLVLMNGERAAGLPHGEAMRYSKVTRPQDPLVPLDLTRGVTERVDAAGNVVVQLNEDEVVRAARDLVAHGAQAIAVSFLWSFRNPSNEQRCRSIITSEFPWIVVVLSSDVSPTLGEYERTATTAICASLGPVLAEYISRLQTELGDRGLTGPVFLVQSQGGLIPAEHAPAKAVNTVSSGLAAGVLGAIYVGERIGRRDLITTDVGGTSFEVSVVKGGKPALSFSSLSPRVRPYESRYRFRAPSTEITAIGAGGGSVAWLDEAQFLHVGPQSAGAVPGPACYGQGGTDPTLTDASVILGFLNPENFLGGRIRLKRERAEEAVMQLGRRLGFDAVETGRAILRVAVSQMADLVRKVTLEQGHDPREFTLMAYGGAGPTFCAYYAKELGINELVVPGQMLASSLTALGAALAPMQRTTTVTYLERAAFNRDRLSAAVARLIEESRNEVRGWGAQDAAIATTVYFHLRFLGQSHEVLVPLHGLAITQDSMNRLMRDFVDRYEDLYGEIAAKTNAPIEMTALTIDTLYFGSNASVRQPRFPQSAGGAAAATAIGSREVHFLDETARAMIYDGTQLRPGWTLRGPAIVEYPNTTVILPSFLTGTVDEDTNLRLSEVSADE